LSVFGRFGREFVRLLAMFVCRRDVFLRLVVIALIVLAGGFVVMMRGGLVAGGVNVSFRSGMVGRGAYSASEAVRASQRRHWSSRCASEAWRRRWSRGAVDFAGK
jgi:hypothetical protein